MKAENVVIKDLVTVLKELSLKYKLIDVSIDGGAVIIEPVDIDESIKFRVEDIENLV